jgi:hypothetical protein
MNYINIWDQSLLLKSWIDGSPAKDIDFEVEIDGKVFHQLCLKAEGIHPDSSRFVNLFDKSIGLGGQQRISSLA